MKSIVAFIHKGNPCYLRYAVEQARSSGYRPILVGDHEAALGVDAEFFPLDDMSDRRKRFLDVYRHCSPNHIEFERFCFERWFALRDVIAQIGQSVYYVDSDVLLFPGAHVIAEQYLHLCDMFDTPWFNWFRSPETLDTYLDFVMAVYADEARMERLSQKYFYQGHPLISDNMIFYEFGYDRAEKVPSLRHFGSAIGIDNCIRHTGGYHAWHGHKAIVYFDKEPYCQKIQGGATKFVTLHLQGHSKKLMQYMHTIENPKIVETLSDLSHLPPGEPGTAEFLDLQKEAWTKRMLAA